MWKAAFSGRSEKGGGGSDGASATTRSSSQRKKSKDAGSVVSSTSRRSTSDRSRGDKSRSGGSAYGGDDDARSYVTAPTSRTSRTSRPESTTRALHRRDGGGDEEEWQDEDVDLKSGRADSARRRKSVSAESTIASENDEKKRRRSKDDTPRSSRNKDRADGGGTDRAIPDMGSFQQFPGQYSDGHMGGSEPHETVMSGALPQRIEGQFPGQQMGPTRADSYGAAADYYFDEGQSVHHQPGVRVKSPNMLVNPDAHLMAASAEAHPVADTGHGSAADFYSGRVSPVLTEEPESMIPSRPGSFPSPGANSSSKPSRTSSLGKIAAAAAGAVGAIAVNSHHEQSSYQQSSSSYEQVGNGVLPGQSPRPSRYDNGRVSPRVDTNGASPSPFSGPPNSRPPYPQNSIPGPTGKVSSSANNVGLYAAGAATAGLAAYEMYEHNQRTDSQYNGTSYSGRPPSYAPQQPPRPYGPAGAGGRMDGSATYQDYHYHEHRGPISRLKDGFFNLIANKEDTARMEEYTEYIGVCKYCFDPRSSPWDGPRQHHFHHGRRDSFESLRRRRSMEKMHRRSQERLSRNNSQRVDKDSRYYASGKSNGKNDLIEAGLAAAGIAGAASVAGGVLGNEFDDAHSVKSGHRSSSAVRRRSRSSSREKRRKATHGSVSKDSREEWVTVRTRDGKIERRRVQRSRSRSKDRRSSSGVLKAAVAGAAIGEAASLAGSSRRDKTERQNGAWVRRRPRSGSRSSSDSDKRSGIRRTNNHRDEVRRSEQRRRSSGASSEAEGGFFGGFFSPPRRRESRRGRSPRTNTGFFGLGNDSTESDLAFGDGVSRKSSSLTGRRSSARLSTAGSNGRVRKKKSDEHLAATLAGIGATATALAAYQRGHRVNKNSHRPELGARKNVQGHQAHSSRDPRHAATVEAEDEDWEDELPSDVDDASSVGSALAFGDFHHRRLFSRPSMESVGSQGSNGADGLGAWGWRWGGKDQKRSRRDSSSQRPLYPPHPDQAAPMGSVAGTVAASGIAAAGLNALGRAPSSTSDISRPPLQEIDPRPMSETSFPQSRDPSFSMPGAFDAIPVARPGPAPLQQPQPIAPIKPAFSNEDFGPRTRPRRSQSSPTRGTMLQDAALVGAAALGTAGIIASQSGRRSREAKDVRFGFTEEQHARHDRELREEQRKTEEARRKAAELQALKDEAERHLREQEVLRARADENQRRAERELERQRAVEREAQQQAEYQRQREAEARRREEENRWREEVARREQARLADEARRKDEERRRWEAEAAERAQQEAYERDRVRREQRASQKPDPERSSDSKWGDVVAGAAAAATAGAVAAGVAHEMSGSKPSDGRKESIYEHETVAPTREPHVEGQPLVDVDIADPDFFTKRHATSNDYDRRAQELARKAADRITAESIIEDQDDYYSQPAQTQADFFAPKELLERKAEGKEKNPDPVGLFSEELAVYHAADDEERNRFPPELRRRYAPYGVPGLNLISPTPPPDLSRMKEIAPSKTPLSQESETDSQPEARARRKSDRSKRISWGEDKTHIYAAQTPESFEDRERDSYVQDHDFENVAAATAAGVAATAGVGTVLAEESKRTAAKPPIRATADNDDGDIEEVQDNGLGDQPQFYRQPFVDSVSDIDLAGFKVDSPGTEGAPAVQGFVEDAEVEDPTPAEEKEPRIPGGWDEEPSASNTVGQKDSRKRSSVSETAFDKGQIEDPTPQEPDSGTVEAAWEPPLSKKDKKKRDKQAKKAGFADVAMAAITAETAEPREEQSTSRAEPSRDVREEELEAPLSKKDKKKRDKAAKRASMTESFDTEPTPREEEAAPEPEWEPPLSKKDKKKLEKQAKKQGFADIASLVAGAGAAAMAAVAVTNSKEGEGESSDTQRGERDGVAKAEEVPDPFQYQIYDQTPAVATANEEDMFAGFAESKKSKKKKKRDSLRYSEPEDVSSKESEARNEFASRDTAPDHAQRNRFSEQVGTALDSQDTEQERDLDACSGTNQRTARTDDRPSSPSILNEERPNNDDLVSGRRPSSDRRHTDEPESYDEASIYDDRRIAASSAEAETAESTRKSKRRSRTYVDDDDDATSVVSSRSRKDQESSSKKDKKSGFFGGIFSRKSADSVPKTSKDENQSLSRTSTRDSRDDNDEDGERRRRRRSHRGSEYGDDDDARSTVSSASHRRRSNRRDEDEEDDEARERRRHHIRRDTDDLDSQSRADGEDRERRRHHHRRNTGDDVETQSRADSESRSRHHHRRRTDEDVSDKDQSFLGSRVEDLPPLPDSVPTELESALAKPEQDDGSPVSAEPDVTLGNHGGHESPSTQQPQLFFSESKDEGPLAYPLSTPASPTAAWDSSPVHRRLSTQRAPSATAVPLRFPFGHHPVTPSPRPDRAVSFSSPIASSPMSPSVQKTRQSRPSSNEFRPLYLVECNRKTPAVDELLPSLPSSKPSSRASSLVGSEEYESAVEDHGSPARRRKLTIHTSESREILPSDDDFLGSQQTTPKAATFAESSIYKLPKQEPQFYTWEDFARDERRQSIAAHQSFDLSAESTPMNVVPDEEVLARQTSTEEAGQITHHSEIHQELRPETQEPSTLPVVAAAGTALGDAAVIAQVDHESQRDLPVATEVVTTQDEPNTPLGKFTDNNESHANQDSSTDPISADKSSLSRQGPSKKKKGKANKKGRSEARRDDVEDEAKPRSEIVALEGPSYRRADHSVEAVEKTEEDPKPELPTTVDEPLDLQPQVSADTEQFIDIERDMEEGAPTEYHEDAMDDPRSEPNTLDKFLESEKLMEDGRTQEKPGSRNAHAELSHPADTFDDIDASLIGTATALPFVEEQQESASGVTPEAELPASPGLAGDTLELHDGANVAMNSPESDKADDDIDEFIHAEEHLEEGVQTGTDPRKHLGQDLNDVDQFMDAEEILEEGKADRQGSDNQPVPAREGVDSPGEIDPAFEGRVLATEIPAEEFTMAADRPLEGDDKEPSEQFTTKATRKQSKKSKKKAQQQQDAIVDGQSAAMKTDEAETASSVVDHLSGSRSNEFRDDMLDAVQLADASLESAPNAGADKPPSTEAVGVSLEAERENSGEQGGLVRSTVQAPIESSSAAPVVETQAEDVLGAFTSISRKKSKKNKNKHQGLLEDDRTNVETPPFKPDVETESLSVEPSAAESELRTILQDQSKPQATRQTEKDNSIASEVETPINTLPPDHIPLPPISTFESEELLPRSQHLDLKHAIDVDQAGPTESEAREGEFDEQSKSDNAHTRNDQQAQEDPQVVGDAEVLAGPISATAADEGSRYNPEAQVSTQLDESEIREPEDFTWSTTKKTKGKKGKKGKSALTESALEPKNELASASIEQQVDPDPTPSPATQSLSDERVMELREAEPQGFWSNQSTKKKGKKSKKGSVAFSLAPRELTSGDKDGDNPSEIVDEAVHIDDDRESTAIDGQSEQQVNADDGVWEGISSNRKKKGRMNKLSTADAALPPVVDLPSQAPSSGLSDARLTEEPMLVRHEDDLTTSIVDPEGAVQEVSRPPTSQKRKGKKGKKSAYQSFTFDETPSAALHQDDNNVLPTDASVDVPRHLDEQKQDVWESIGTRGFGSLKQEDESLAQKDVREAFEASPPGASTGPKTIEDTMLDQDPIANLEQDQPGAKTVLAKDPEPSAFFPGPSKKKGKNKKRNAAVEEQPELPSVMAPEIERVAETPIDEQITRSIHPSMSDEHAEMMGILPQENIETNSSEHESSDKIEHVQAPDDQAFATALLPGDAKDTTGAPGTLDDFSKDLVGQEAEPPAEPRSISSVDDSAIDSTSYEAAEAVHPHESPVTRVELGQSLEPRRETSIEDLSQTSVARPSQETAEITDAADPEVAFMSPTKKVKKDKKGKKSRSTTFDMWAKETSESSTPERSSILSPDAGGKFDSEKATITEEASKPTVATLSTDAAQAEDDDWAGFAKKKSKKERKSKKSVSNAPVVSDNTNASGQAPLQLSAEPDSVRPENGPAVETEEVISDDLAGTNVETSNAPSAQEKSTAEGDKGVEPEEIARPESDDTHLQSHMDATPQHDIDFTATVAAGLADSGFDPDLVVNDPVFQRRSSPPGSLAEADPEEVFSSFGKKKKKGKKGKKANDFNLGPGASESDARQKENSVGFDEILAQSLASSGFDTALLEQNTPSTKDVPGNEPMEDSEFSFATSKRKKNKKSRASQASQPSASFEDVGTTRPAQELGGDSHLEEESALEHATLSRETESRSQDMAMHVDQPPLEILATSGETTESGNQSRSEPEDLAITLAIAGEKDLDIDEMDQSYRTYKKNKRNRRKQEAAAEATRRAEDEKSEVEAQGVVRSNAGSTPKQTVSEDTRAISDDQLDEHHRKESNPERQLQDHRGRRSASPSSQTSSIVQSVFPGLERVKLRSPPIRQENTSSGVSNTGTQQEASDDRRGDLPLHAMEAADAASIGSGLGRSIARAHSRHRDPSLHSKRSLGLLPGDRGDHDRKEGDWSFDALEEDSSSNAQVTSQEGVRDSGYEPAPIVLPKSASDPERDPLAMHKGSFDQLREEQDVSDAAQLSARETTGTESGSSRDHPSGEDNQATNDHGRSPSGATDDTPLQSASKNRTSYLFQSPPDALREGSVVSDPPTPSQRAGSFNGIHTESREGGLEQVRGNDDDIYQLSPTMHSGPMSPPSELGTIHEENHPPKRSIGEMSGQEPDLKAINRSVTPQAIREQEMAVHSALFRSQDGSSTESHAMSKPFSPGEPHSSAAWPGTLEGNASESIIERPFSQTRRMPDDLRSQSVLSNRSNASASNFKSAAELRSFSRASNRSSTPGLRRTSMSGDLRAASSRDDAGSAAGATSSPKTILFQAPPTPPPNDDEDDRSAAMADVYSGFGDAQRSQVSPTRPPSMRKRQSMHVMELESRLDQLMAENQALHDARKYQEGYNGGDFNSDELHNAIAERDEKLREKDELLNQIRAMLEPMQEEIARLSEINDELTTANRNLVDDTNGRYATLQQEHAHAHEQWQSASRDLDAMRAQNINTKSAAEAEITAALADKNMEIQRLQEELDDAVEKIRALQMQIQSSKKGDYLSVRDEDYFDGACQKLCQHVQQWVLRFSKLSDDRICRLSSDLNDDKIEARIDNAILDGSDADKLLGDRVRRRDVFMSLVMTMVWEYVFTRYLFGMDREQRQKLKTLEKSLSEVGPRRAVAQWRATTLTLLSKRPGFKEQRDLDVEAVASEIFSLLRALLPPPSNAEPQLMASLQKVIGIAADLHIEMRTQRAEYIMLPPLQPEFDTNGDLVRQVHFNASLMNERSGVFGSNKELEENRAVVKIVLFPLVVKEGDEFGEGDDKLVISPAQVLVVNESGRSRKIVRVQSGAMEIDDGRYASQMSLTSTIPGSTAY